MRKIIGSLLSVVLIVLLCSCGAGDREAPAEAADMRGTLIAHAGGAIYGYRYTNSKEALDEAYDSGFRFIEVDMELTSDGYAVCIHDWESIAERYLFSAGRRTRSEFLSGRTFEDLTLMDLDMLVSWLEKHPGCRIITDVKADNGAVLGQIAERGQDIAKRFIPQIYSFDEYDSVKNMGFEDIILTLYRADRDEDSLLRFLSENTLWGLTVPRDYISEEFLSAFGGLVHVYTHSINDLWYYEEWAPLGLYGIYTDYFIPDHWPY